MFAGPQVWQDVLNEIKNYPKHHLKKLIQNFYFNLINSKKKNKIKRIQACLDSVTLDYCFVKIKKKKI